LYVSVMARPDVAYHLSVLCKYMSNPSTACYDAAINVLLYLYTSRQRRLTYTGAPAVPAPLHVSGHSISQNMGFHAYSDASWGVPNPSFGFVIFMCGAPVSWASKTCKSADSSCEAEYTAASKCCRDIHFLRLVVEDLGYLLSGQLIIGVDNTAAIQVATNEGVTGRNRHFERECHYIRLQVSRLRVALVYVPTAFQTADCFTKAMDKTNLLRHLHTIFTEP